MNGRVKKNEAVDVYEHRRNVWLTLTYNIIISINSKYIEDFSTFQIPPIIYHNINKLTFSLKTKLYIMYCTYYFMLLNLLIACSIISTAIFYIA